jgi:Mrp family chromosome partitioning ATPase
VRSPSSGDGRSTIAASLAIASAEAGHSVILVDADLRRPAQARIFGLGPSRSLRALLSDPAQPVSAALRATSTPSLHVVLGDPGETTGSRVFSSRGCADRLEQLRAACDVVIFDGPAALDGSDSALIASRVDGVLLVVDASRGRLGSVSQALATLEQAGGIVVGAVLNRAGRSPAPAPAEVRSADDAAAPVWDAASGAPPRVPARTS